MSEPELAPLGKYQLVRKLATGGMAEVFLAKVAGPGGFEKTLVLKRVLPQLATDENFISMFLSEAKLAAQLNHPNVVSIFDFGQDGETWFLVMEYIDGPNLRSLYKRAFELNLPPAFNLAAKIISQACEGLAYAHEFVDPETGEPMNLVHRDVSPDNILLGRNGGVKVVDFGIAKAANQTHHTKTGAIKGKFAYMPPEQLRGEQLDRRSDVFALGIVLYELISGTKPFNCATDATIMQAILFEPFSTAAEHRPDTPPQLQQIVDRALEKDRQNRYADCREMQADLDHFIVTQGASVGQHQLAQLVGRLASASPVAMATPSRPSQPSAPRPSRPKPVQSSAGTVPMPALAVAESRAVVALPRSKLPVILTASAVLLSAIGGAVGWKWAQAQPQPKPVEPVEQPRVVVQVDSPRPPPAEPTPPIVEAPAVDPLPVPVAPVVAEAHPKPAPNKPTRPKPAVREPPKPAPVAVAAAPPKADYGLVDIRVRPYASVYVDGALLGVTPFPKVKLSIGVHSVKLVNKDIGKEITLKYEVAAGENSLKYNLETE